MGIVFESWAGTVTQTLQNAYAGGEAVDHLSYDEAEVLATVGHALAQRLGVPMPHDPAVKVWRSGFTFHVTLAESPYNEPLAELVFKVKRRVVERFSKKGGRA